MEEYKNSMKKPYQIYQGDCLEIMPQLINDEIKVDFILTDVPYGTVNGMILDDWNSHTVEWDECIPTEEMFNCCEKLLRVNGTLILFSQEKYTSYLRQYNFPNLPFIYPYYWEKDHFANPLTFKKAPVSYIEDLSVFRKKYDSDNSHPLRVYAQQLLNQMGVTSKQIERQLGHRKAEHFFYSNNATQFGLCTEQTYIELINEYHINELPCFKPYEELQEIDMKFKPIFNLNEENTKGNILKYKKPYNHFHPTEKPVDLLEDLIKTYTHEGDLVLDFTMGSGSTGVACMNLNRKFIGIELEKEYLDIAHERINTASKSRQTKLTKD